MGMFDYVDFIVECPECGSLMRDFQSKDGPNNLDHLQPWEVNNFYSSCESCGAWIDYFSDHEPPKRFIPPEPEGWRKNLKLNVTPARKKEPPTE